MTKRETQELETALEHVDYTCGSSLLDYASVYGSVLEKVFVRKDFRCFDTVEVPYYSSGAFNVICVHCASGSDIIPELDSYPMCVHCVNARKPKVMKRKRKLFLKKK